MERSTSEQNFENNLSPRSESSTIVQDQVEHLKQEEYSRNLLATDEKLGTRTNSLEKFSDTKRKNTTLPSAKSQYSTPQEVTESLPKLPLPEAKKSGLSFILAKDHEKNQKVYETELKKWQSALEVEKKTSEGLEVENEELSKEKSEALSDRSDGYKRLHRLSLANEETHDKLKSERDLKRRYEREKNILERDLAEAKRRIQELEEENRRLLMRLDLENNRQKRVEQGELAQLQSIVENNANQLISPKKQV